MGPCVDVYEAVVSVTAVALDAVVEFYVRLRQRAMHLVVMRVRVLDAQNLRTKLESERSAEIRRIDEQKARHVAALTKAHEIAFQVLCYACG